MRSFRPLSDRPNRRRLIRRQRTRGSTGRLRRESIADGAMARSLVADLSGRTAEAISTTTTRRVPAPAAPRAAAIPLWIDQLEAAFLHFDGHPDTAAAFGAAGKRARAL